VLTHQYDGADHGNRVESVVSDIRGYAAEAKLPDDFKLMNPARTK
jgi:hypothetical protein